MSTAEPAPAEPGAAEPAPAESPVRRRGRPKGSTARTTRVIELTLTVSGTADGEWQAELKQGSAWITRGLPVTAAAVSRAAAELHPEVAEPIDAVIGAAREQRAARVATLEAELEQARKALAELDEPSP
jgi:predicted nucleic acid-binding protein